MALRIYRTPAVRSNAIAEAKPEEMLTDYPKLLGEYRELRTKYSELRATHEVLERRHRTLRKRCTGLVGEEYILNLTLGLGQSYAADFDVRSASQHRIEVKTSALLPNGGFGSFRKWKWSNLLGEKRDRVFDYLILLGEPDSRHPTPFERGEYTLFCVPFDRVELLMDNGGGLTCGTSLRGPMASQMTYFWMVPKEWIAESFGDAAMLGVMPVYPHEGWRSSRA